MRINYIYIIVVIVLFIGINSTAYTQCSEPIPAPADAIYSWQFDGGLEGWRATNSMDEDVNQTVTLPVNPDAGTIIGWVWDAEGRISGGEYNDGNNGKTDFIESPSVCNGAIVFNSDFYDSRGGDGFGYGVCPNGNGLFCEGWLKSPAIDLSDHEGEVALQFNQGVRQFTSEFFVYVSKDGGATYFDTIQINEEIPIFSLHLLDDVLIVPLCGVANEPNIRIDFLYRGSYFYWSIDDVAIIPNVQPDLKINSVAVSSNYGTPAEMLIELPFLAEIENYSSVQSISPELTITVRDTNNNTVHTQTMVYPDIPGCNTIENEVFPETFLPPEVLGLYGVEYVIKDLDDSNSSNDTVLGQFEITLVDFEKVLPEREVGIDYLDGTRYKEGSFQSWGSYFYFPSNSYENYITNVSAGIVPAEGEEIGVGEIVCAIYQWIDINGDGIVNSNNSEEKIKLGESTYIVSPDNADLRDFTFIPLDEEGELIIPESGAEIIVMLHTNPFNGELNYYGLNSPSQESVSYSTGTSTTAYGELQLAPRYGSFGGVGTSHDDRDEERDFFPESKWTWFVNIEVTTSFDYCIGTSTENINENISVDIYPSPANELINVKLDIEELSPNVNIEMVNMSGIKVGSYNYTNIKNDKLSIDVSDYTSGMYLGIFRSEDIAIS